MGAKFTHLYDPWRRFLPKKEARENRPSHDMRARGELRILFANMQIKRKPRGKQYQIKNASLYKQIVS